MRHLIRFFRLLPARLELEHLRWARKQMGPLHRDLPIVIRRIRTLEDHCRA